MESAAGATANQVELVNLVVNHLTEHGVMEPSVLYESPFTDASPRGPEGTFSPAHVDHLIGVLAEIRERAAAGPVSSLRLRAGLRDFSRARP